MLEPPLRPGLHPTGLLSSETGASHVLITFLVFSGLAQLFSYSLSACFITPESGGVKPAMNPPLSHEPCVRPDTERPWTPWPSRGCLLNLGLAWVMCT